MKIAGRILLAAVPLAFVCVASGCGGGQGYKAAPVSGTVTIDGNPVAGIVVTFQPVGAGQTPGPGSTGKTDENGKFTLRFATQDRKPGAVVGKHRVSFATWMEEQGDVTPRGGGAKELVPRRYQGQAMEFEVKAGGTDKADFPLTSK